MGRIIEILRKACKLNASDIHIHQDLLPYIRILSNMECLNDELIITLADIEEFFQLVVKKPDGKKDLKEKGSLDIGYINEELGTFRINFFYQQGKLAISIRILPTSIPCFESLNLYPQVKNITKIKSGLVLITGVTGNGKSTTIASLVNVINQEQNKHIITIEDPIEYRYPTGKSLVSQREVGSDCSTFAEALRAALRQDPDVIVIGEMRDKETIKIAIEAAESGHLVLSTLHTGSAAASIERIISYFDGEEQLFLRFKLAMVLSAVITQQLVLSTDKEKLYPAQEVMFANNAISALIRDGKCYQINNFIQTNKKDGFIVMEDSLAELFNRNLITLESAVKHANDVSVLKLYIHQYPRFLNLKIE